MKKIIVLFINLFIIQLMAAQEAQLPLKEIPTAPDTFSSGNMVARMIEGLGFRYYWASKDLKEEDLAYKPSDDARNIMETLQHIYGLTNVIKNGPTSTANGRGEDLSKYSYGELRKMTLDNLNEAALLMRDKTSDDVANMKVVFDRGGQTSEFPFWNMINGPIADAIYHTGQVVTMRRSNGNPINPKISVFTGKVRE
ncbi:DinB family protein [Spongiivirga citrea]|uniref:DinB family protein n=1 Tax=Spongiivirga citrea TaxID=1481457 RepID=A0A6M0CT19_9FLAO|nr:hypothetical protein [Spongiivirga citrea]NER18657.1 hypothetical protein [Spongiivirga citrea]